MPLVKAMTKEASVVLSKKLLPERGSDQLALLPRKLFRSVGISVDHLGKEIVLISPLGSSQLEPVPHYLIANCHSAGEKGGTSIMMCSKAGSWHS